jgi:hypothetical protein
MSFNYNDDVRREPRYAAHWAEDDPDAMTIDIIYLQGYWVDNGDGGQSGNSCGYLGFLLSSSCNGHAGDSEFARLRIKYDPDSKHWFLSNAWLSVHETELTRLPGAQSDTLESVYMVALGTGDGVGMIQYPDKKGGYPRMFAADGKHANYPSAAYCDSHGGILLGVNLASDDCDPSRYEARLEVSYDDANVGSSTHQLINCVPTRRTDHPAYLLGLTECYWTAQLFRGWFNQLGVTLTFSYGTILSNSGF